jgi:hypothetical protein
MAIKISLLVAIKYFGINIPAWAAGTIVDTTLPTLIDQGVKSWV